MGNFPTLRNSLRCRQWIEKNYKTRQTNANIAQVMVYHRENAVDEGQCNTSDQQDDLSSKSSSSDDSLKEVVKADAKALLIRAKHSSPSLDSILDRQCRLMVSKYNFLHNVVLPSFSLQYSRKMIRIIHY